MTTYRITIQDRKTTGYAVKCRSDRKTLTGMRGLNGSLMSEDFIVLQDVLTTTDEYAARIAAEMFNGTVEAIETPTNPATPAQVNYLRTLGYTGDTMMMSKSDASRMIDSLKAGRSYQSDTEQVRRDWLGC